MYLTLLDSIAGLAKNTPRPNLNNCGVNMIAYRCQTAED